MKKRPVSVTVIAWILLVVGGLSLLGGIMTINDPKAQEVMAKSSVPVPVQYTMMFLGLAIEILSAIFMLRGANWARWLYIGWGGVGLLFGLVTSPVKAMLAPAILIYATLVFFLLRPKATAYFTFSADRADAPSPGTG